MPSDQNASGRSPPTPSSSGAGLTDGASILTSSRGTTVAGRTPPTGVQALPAGAQPPSLSASRLSSQANSTAGQGELGGVFSSRTFGVPITESGSTSMTTPASSTSTPAGPSTNVAPPVSDLGTRAGSTPSLFAFGTPTPATTSPQPPAPAVPLVSAFGFPAPPSRALQLLQSTGTSQTQVPSITRTTNTTTATPSTAVPGDGRTALFPNLPPIRLPPFPSFGPLQTPSASSPPPTAQVIPSFTFGLPSTSASGLGTSAAPQNNQHFTFGTPAASSTRPAYAPGAGYDPPPRPTLPFGRPTPYARARVSDDGASSLRMSSPLQPAATGTQPRPPSGFHFNVQSPLHTGSEPRPPSSARAPPDGLPFPLAPLLSTAQPAPAQAPAPPFATVPTPGTENTGQAGDRQITFEFFIQHHPGGPVPMAPTAGAQTPSTVAPAPAPVEAQTTGRPPIFVFDSRGNLQMPTAAGGAAGAAPANGEERAAVQSATRGQDADTAPRAGNGGNDAAPAGIVRPGFEQVIMDAVLRAFQPPSAGNADGEAPGAAPAGADTTTQGGATGQTGGPPGPRVFFLGNNGANGLTALNALGGAGAPGGAGAEGNVGGTGNMPFNFNFPGFMPIFDWMPMSRERTPDPARAQELLRGMQRVSVGNMRRVERIARQEHPDGEGWRCGVCLDGWEGVDDEAEDAEGGAEVKAEAGGADGDRVVGEGAKVSGSLDRETNVKALPCNHLFHADCLEPWFQSKHTCPACRLNLDPFRVLASPTGEVTRPATTRPAAQEAREMQHPFRRMAAARMAMTAGFYESPSTNGSAPPTAPASPTTRRHGPARAESSTARGTRPSGRTQSATASVRADAGGVLPSVRGALSRLSRFVSSSIWGEDASEAPRDSSSATARASSVDTTSSAEGSPRRPLARFPRMNMDIDAPLAPRRREGYRPAPRLEGEPDMPSSPSASQSSEADAGVRRVADNGRAAAWEEFYSPRSTPPPGPDQGSAPEIGIQHTASPMPMSPEERRRRERERAPSVEPGLGTMLGVGSDLARDPANDDPVARFWDAVHARGEARAPVAEPFMDVPPVTRPEGAAGSATTFTTSLPSLWQSFGTQRAPGSSNTNVEVGDGAGNRGGASASTDTVDTSQPVGPDRSNTFFDQRSVPWPTTSSVLAPLTRASATSPIAIPGMSETRDRAAQTSTTAATSNRVGFVSAAVPASASQSAPTYHDHLGHRHRQQQRGSDRDRQLGNDPSAMDADGEDMDLDMELPLFHTTPGHLNPSTSSQTGAQREIPPAPRPWNGVRTPAVPPVPAAGDAVTNRTNPFIFNFGAPGAGPPATGNIGIGPGGATQDPGARRSKPKRAKITIVPLRRWIEKKERDLDWRCSCRECLIAPGDEASMDPKRVEEDWVREGVERGTIAIKNYAAMKRKREGNDVDDVKGKGKGKGRAEVDVPHSVEKRAKVDQAAEDVGSDGSGASEASPASTPAPLPAESDPDPDAALPASGSESASAPPRRKSGEPADPTLVCNHRFHAACLGAYLRDTGRLELAPVVNGRRAVQCAAGSCRRDGWVWGEELRVDEPARE